ncbi:protein hairy [Agrilus planipennis]|uniref:Protein hairy n=1 Tax=Agrilus planipennis TaxID=224129 RepID=A0A1W4XEE8_AGRPL|nr:protein hairy [Agrilus planipennis]
MVTGNENINMGSAPMPNNPTVDSSGPTKRVSDSRRSNKPIMEKRRRARINNCLNELKTLILDAMKKDPARHSKLEKADILEMTVKHLQNLQRQQVAISAATDPSVINKFRAGFGECANEVGRFPGLDPVVKRRLLQHLAACLNQGKPEQPHVQVHIIPSQSSELQPQQHSTGGLILSNGSGTGVQLVPTRLPNGDIALVLPSTSTTTGSTGSNNNNSTTASSLPLLVPIPNNRTSSVASPSSTSSASPEPMDSLYYGSSTIQKPLSLVIRKIEQKREEERWPPRPLVMRQSDQPEDEKPWRPW